MESQYRIGVYCQISDEDLHSGKTVNISRQKELLKSYAESRHWSVTDSHFYTDEGCSSSSASDLGRPGLKRLWDDIQAKRINVVAVTSLDRLGSDVQRLLSSGCRLISLLDGIDTGGQNDPDSFLRLFDEYYSRDTSQKVRTAKRLCAERGMFMGTYPAYGYQRDPQNKYHLIIDEETAPIVKKIFSLRISGMSIHEISSALEAADIPSPRTLYYQRKAAHSSNHIRYHWSDSTVRNILRNEVYIGNMVQGKTGSQAWNSQKLISKPEDQWVRTEHTHEPIISGETWTIASDIDRKNLCRTSNTSILTGLLFCSDISDQTDHSKYIKMQCRSEAFTDSDGTAQYDHVFFCPGDQASPSHVIREDELTSVILEKIRADARSALQDPIAMKNMILRLKSRPGSCLPDSDPNVKQLSELEAVIRSLHQDVQTGMLSQSTFDILLNGYKKKRSELLNAVPSSADRLHLNQAIDHWITLISPYSELDSLSPPVLFSLLDRITIESCAFSEQSVRLYYRDIGCIDGPYNTKMGV